MKSFKPVKSIVVPIDFSDNSEHIAHSAAYVAGKFSADIHIIYVIHDFDYHAGFFSPIKTVPELEEELHNGAVKKMADFCKASEQFFKDQGVAVVTSKVLVGDVNERIVEYADDIEAGMIIMGTHGYKGMEKIMFGSIAAKVVQNANCPVLTINPYKK